MSNPEASSGLRCAQRGAGRGEAGLRPAFYLTVRGILLLFGCCVVLWLCSLVFGFGALGRLDKLGTGGTEGIIESFV